MCIDAALDTLMQDGNEPCEPPYLEQLRLSLLPERSDSTPALLRKALWSSPARGLLESMGCTAELPPFSSFASQHNSFHWQSDTGQKDPFGVGNSFTYISKAE